VTIVWGLLADGAFDGIVFVIICFAELIRRLSSDSFLYEFLAIFLLSVGEFL
jgi:hypothetical protein